ncbi:uncharacterized protein LOC126908473 isoform X2 [Daktulosphaira vitifoliae]|uniref:uncharacterized protein LOC126908473 isoform X2 n=1 Tax=Daktulosphaira vitifoliae TaxID=58002 RepID=UPI0021AA0A2C|nr:uncharacterized protein LOC126908473 isoform X2 [Daktulosphaira vitifoliae]
MFSLKLYKFSFVFFYVILCTKEERGTNKSVNEIDTLLMYSGWKNLNDIIRITYLTRNYYLEDLIQTPTHRNKCYQKIRALTAYLGCTYAKVINDLFSVIIIVTQNCQKKIEEENDLKYGCICTEEFINIISMLVVPMTTLMKGAMDTLDLLHKKPWQTIKKPHFLLNSLLGRIENILDILNKLTLSRNDISSFSKALFIIHSFTQRTIINVNHETLLYCKFVTYDTNYLWNKWVQEYEVISDQEKYFQLGFKFDPMTEETFIPTPQELIELELEFKVIDATVPPTPIQIENH